MASWYLVLWIIIDGFTYLCYILAIVMALVMKRKILNLTRGKALEDTAQTSSTTGPKDDQAQASSEHDV